MALTKRSQVPARRILLLARDPADIKEIPARLRDTAPRVEAHATRRMGEALSLLSRESFSAAVCSVEFPTDVAIIIRFKKTSPRTPVLALALADDSEVAALALQLGAAAVIKQEADPRATADTLRDALDPHELARRVRNRAASGYRIAQQIRELSARARMVAADALARLSRTPADGFEPLLVENDPNEALFFARALRKVGLPRRLPIARSGREAIDYLSGRGEFGDRVRFPAPSIVILDYHLGADTGEDVLRFIRSHPSLERLPVVLFSSSQNPEEVGRMLNLGVSAHIIKPHSIDELCEAVRLILDFWQMWRSHSADAGGYSTRARGSEEVEGSPALIT